MVTKELYRAGSSQTVCNTGPLCAVSVAYQVVPVEQANTALKYIGKLRC